MGFLKIGFIFFIFLACPCHPEQQPGAASSSSSSAAVGPLVPLPEDAIAGRISRDVMSEISMKFQPEDANGISLNTCRPRISTISDTIDPPAGLSFQNLSPSKSAAVAGLGKFNSTMSTSTTMSMTTTNSAMSTSSTMSTNTTMSTATISTLTATYRSRALNYLGVKTFAFCMLRLRAALSYKRNNNRKNSLGFSLKVSQSL